jgi:hypothetical protein
MSILDFRAFAIVLSEITIDGSRVEGVGRPDVPGFLQEIIERELSGDSRMVSSFLEICQILKQNRFETVADIDCDEISRFVNEVESLPLVGSKAIILTLAKRQISHFYFLFTGDESWLFYSYHRKAMWVRSWSDVDDTERSSHFRNIIMITVFFNGTGESRVDLLPEGKKMDHTYFTQRIIDPLEELCYHDCR